MLIPEKQVYKRGGKHHCEQMMESAGGIEQCAKCHVMKANGQPHFCYVQPIQPKVNTQDVRYIFFDIEASQSERIEINGIKVSFGQTMNGKFSNNLKLFSNCLILSL